MPKHPLSLRNGLALVAVAFFASLIFSSCKQEDPRVLVFSKTAGFRHESIGAGKAAMQALGAKHHFAVDTTEDASAFNEENLKKYHAVVFLNTTGNVLNAEQQNHFERYIQAGGGFVGIHAASDTEYDWPWYGKLVGAYFKDHPGNPNVREGEFHVVDKNHPSCDSLPERFKRTDEFYSFRNMSTDIKVLVDIDENSYLPGDTNSSHPMSWYQEYDGGRAFYTAMGHTDETYEEPLFLSHIWGGLKYVLNNGKPKSLDYSKAHTLKMPEENRFVKVVLAEKLNEPIELVNLPSGNVLFIERHGAVKVYDQQSKQVLVIDSIPVSTKYTDPTGRVSEAEDGLLGVQLDPNFAKNHFIYLYYSQFGEQPVNVLARYEMDGETSLIESSKKIILEVPVQREQCCHTGGSIAFDGQGNLYVSTGDNTSPRGFSYGPTDERPGRSPWDAQKSSGNTNDLRGKIIRIHPEPDGSYTIPEGNLFPKGTPGTRPEIYVMGTRNPYRISVDKKTGFLYWGEVGPDANKDSTAFGSRGYDEVNQARKAGYFGWPYFVGDNQPYVQYDFASGKSGELRNPVQPVNYSPNNTGLKELPAAQKAFIWYPYAKSAEFPLVGSGSRNAMAGPVFYSADFKGAERAFPDYYDGKLFIYDWMRGWIMAVTMNEAGDYQSMEPFMGSHKFSNPTDMEFAK
ncbi:MAG: ThuA domain-containing protein, partial [Bacteroidetes bacterium]